MQLNRFLAQQSKFSRRAINQFIKAGQVKVNGKVVYGFTHDLKDQDTIHFREENAKPNFSVITFQQAENKETVNLMLNKPPGVVTSKRDAWHKKTVFDLLPKRKKVKQGEKEESEQKHFHYVGRLDKETTGLLLFTNNGKLTNVLTHPKNRIQKTYVVKLVDDLKKYQLEKIKRGILLEDGFIKPDTIKYKAGSKKHLEIVLHSGKKRIIRRIFFSLGHKITELERINFAGIGLDGLELGKWRFLTTQENHRLEEILKNK